MRHSRIRVLVRIVFTLAVLLAAGGVSWAAAPQGQTQAASGVLESTSFGPTQDGTASPFDSNNDPGNDDGANNGIVRSWDKIITRANLTFATANAPYDVTFTLSGTLDNGMVNKQIQNAGFDDTVGGAYSYTNNTVTFSTEQTFHVTSTNSVDVVNVPINVYGAQNGTVLTPHLHVHVTKVVSGTTTTPEDISQDITTPATSDTQTCFKVSSKVNLGVVVVDDSGTNGVQDFNTYTGATGTAQKKAQVGALNFGVGLKPLSGRTNFLGTAYPDPNSTITVNFAQSANISGNAISLATDPVQTFQISQARASYTTIPLFASLYPGAKTKPGIQMIPFGWGGLAEAGQDVINSVINTGTITADTTKLSYSFNGWQAGGVTPNNNGNGSTITDPWAQQTKLFLSASATLILPTDQYTDANKAAKDTLNWIASTASVNYVDNAQKDEAAADALKILPSDSTMAHDSGYGDSETWSYNPTTVFGSQSMNTILKDDNYNLLGATYWENYDAAAYSGQKIITDMHFGAYAINIGTGADTYEIWNPNESKFDDTFQPYMPGNDANGKPFVPQFWYGVSKTGKYDLASLNSADDNSFTWYDTAAKAEAAGAISAIKNVVNQPYDTSQCDWYFRRIVTTTHPGTAEANGNPYITIARAVSYYGARTDPSSTYWFPWGSYNYVPSVYNRAPSATDQTSGFVPGTTKGYKNKIGTQITDADNGDYSLATLLVEPYLTRLDAVTSNAPQYHMSDTAKFTITPDIEAAEKDITTSTVTLTVTLPAGVTYVGGSLKQGGTPITPHLKQNTDHTTTMTLSLDHPTGGVQPDLTFSTTFDQIGIDFGADVTKKLSVTAVISSPDDSSVIATRTKSASFTALKDTAIVGDKQSADGAGKTYGNTAIVERNSEFYFQVHMRNDYSSAYTVNILDRLPANGQKGVGDTASQFSGGYALEDIQPELAGSTIWYTYDPAFAPDGSGTNNADTAYAAISGITDPTKKWYQYTPGTDLSSKYDENKPITAFIFHQDNLPVGGSNVFTMKYKPMPTASATSGNLSGDVYANTVSYHRTPDAKTQAITNTATVNVVNRTITGNVWHDGNGDGMRFNKGASEPGIAGWHVHLWKITGGTATLVTKDINGQDLTHVTTDANGNYTLTHLDAGTYRVGFSEADMTGKGLKATKLKADPTDLANSSILDTSQEATDSTTGTKDYLSADTYTLPAIADMTGTTGAVISNVNAGFVTTINALAFSHVPDLYFGQHSVPKDTQIYDNVADTAAGETTADNQFTITDLAANLSDDFNVTAALSDFKRASTIGLQGSSIVFAEPSDTAFTVPGTAITTAGTPATIFSHSGTTQSPMNLRFSNIQLTVPAGQTGTTVGPGQYQATVTYTLNLGL